MFNSSSMILSPIGKRRELSSEEDEQDDIALETSQLMIRSPPPLSNQHYHHHTNHINNSNKRPRYEPGWTLDNLCTHPCSPLASIDLEVIIIQQINKYCVFHLFLTYA
jgi:hypothetical protein